jgi:hypothetical protein
MAVGRGAVVNEGRIVLVLSMTVRAFGQNISKIGNCLGGKPGAGVVFPFNGGRRVESRSDFLNVSAGAWHTAWRGETQQNTWKVVIKV